MIVAGLIIAGCLGWTDDESTAKLPPASTRKVDFEADVRPIFAASCLGCHGPKKRKGGLALHHKAVGPRRAATTGR